ncbi:S-layer homology domain-containing protein [Bacillus sp. FJAT-26390]|uniref:S-layer homology domain-containing protein n=1 Tax=Bacillus sp. FJAT-26390 TaxID=1743142 RepID=UPI000807FDB1|nr:S-layer homology domain-containing protein [Bacillus sp. FJAT-26390]OBZ12590.1 hypothetical protein A7975_16395 [Bacillus sp. FJAT-26390]
MKTQALSQKLLALILSLTVFITAASSAFLPAAKVAAEDANPDLGPFTIYDLLPAPGQFVNESGFGGIGDVNQSWNNNVLSSGVSLGGFGGAVVFKTNAPVQNSKDHPYGVDFTVYGNAFSGFEEPGAVAVAQDDGTGKPAKWYYIAGSEHYEDSTIWDYATTYTNPDPEFAAPNGLNVPWADNEGATGFIKTNSFHKHSYYPIPANYPLAQPAIDNLARTYSGVKVTTRNTAFGYTDTHSNGSAPYNVAGNPYVPANAKGEGIDISWAVDENGMPVNLESIDFIKVYTAVQIDGGPFGEISTEVTSLQLHDADSAIEQTPSLSSITLAGIEHGSGSKEVTIQDSVYVYKDIKVNADTIKVTANTTKKVDQLFVNNTSGAVNTPVDKILTLNEKKPRIVRVIAQEGNKEPRIYYLSILKGSEKVDSAINNAAKYIKSKGVTSEWQALALAQAGQKTPAAYYEQLVANLKKTNNTFTFVTDYARFSMAISALGYDAEDFASYNLIEKIYNHKGIVSQGLNGPLYSLIALDSGNYKLPEDSLWTRDKLVEAIVNKQLPDGGFAWGGSNSEADMTAMALIALAPYMDKVDVKTAGEKAIQWLSINQKTHGGYGGESSESISQAIIGLTAHGIDPTGVAFTKNGINLLDKLLSFAQADGGFSHLLTGKSNGMATEQALQALDAYSLFANKKGRLYDFAGRVMPGVAFAVDVAVDIEGPQANIATGTANGYSALDALKDLTADQKIALQVTTHPSFGDYVTSIAGISEKTYQGYDGWQYAIKRNGEWITPSVGIADFVLEESDHLTVYYGDFDTQFVHAVTTAPSSPKAGQPFSVTVSKEGWDWNNHVPVVTPAAGAKVTIGNQSALADDNGVAAFPNGIGTAGLNNGEVTQYRSDNSPSIVRQSFALTISPADPNPVDQYVTLKVLGDKIKGTILGSKSLKLQEGDTAFSILQRELGGKVVSSGTGPSTYVSAIDGLAEFDRGTLSGWMYSVNGTFPDVSAGAYLLQPNDEVAWRYTVDGGKDLGSSNPVEGPIAGQPEVPSSISKDVISEFTKLTLSANNTTPIDKVGQTTVSINANTPMSAAELAELIKLLNKSKVKLSQSAASSNETIIQDSDAKVKLVLPAGSVKQNTAISIEELTLQRDELASGVFEFTPNGTVFQNPVFIQIKVPVQTKNVNDLSLAWLDEKTGLWIPIPAVLDLKTGIITGKTTHFTKYAVVDRSKLSATGQDVTSEIQAASKQIANAGTISDWEAIALARSGNKLPASYLVDITKLLKENKGEFRKVTDLERIALALRANGENPASFAGYNLIQSIYNHANMTSQGTNGPIFALIALDSGKYEVATNALWTRTKLVDWLLSQQNASGAFPLSEKGEDNMDITAMAITALSSYKEQANVKSAIDKAVKWLSAQQQENGGYTAFGESNSESVAQVVIALASAGISPLDSSFVKKNGNLLTNLLSFRQSDGGFAHTIGQPSNEIATEQALMALVAYDRFMKLKPALFNLSADTPVTGEKQSFVDNKLISIWAYDAVYRVFDAKIMVGVSGSELRFDPKKQMTRAEFATLLINLLEEKPANDAAKVFKDVLPGAWYYGAIMRAKELGIIQGITADTFKPNQAVSRQDMAIMIAKAFKLKGSTEPLPFQDDKTIHEGAKAYVNAVYQNGLMQGANGNFLPKDAVTREMAAVVADKLLKLPAA